MQFAHVQLAQASEQPAHSHRAWLQVGQEQSAHWHSAQESEQFAQEHWAHSS